MCILVAAFVCVYVYVWIFVCKAGDIIYLFPQCCSLMLLSLLAIHTCKTLLNTNCFTAFLASSINQEVITSIFSRVLRDSTTCFVGPLVCPSVCPLVHLSVHHTLLFLAFCGLWPHCSFPSDQVTSDMAPAHLHATGVAVYPALVWLIFSMFRATWAGLQLCCSVARMHLDHQGRFRDQISFN